MPTRRPSRLNWKFYLLELPFWALLLALILAALLSLALRLALPQLHLAQKDITAWLNQRLPFNLEIHQLEGKIQGLNLSLAAQNLHLQGEGEAFLNLNEIYVELNSLTSLLALKPLVKKLEVKGLEVWLEETPTGWQLLNIEQTAKEAKLPENSTLAKTKLKNKLKAEEVLGLLETLLAQGEVNLKNLQVHLQPLNEAPLHLEAASMGYNRYSSGWQFNFELANSQTPTQKAQLLINLEGSKLNLNAAKIDAWFNLPHINLTDYQHLWPKSLPQEILQLEGEVALQGWFNWQQQQASGHLEAQNLQLKQLKVNGQPSRLSFNQARLSFTAPSLNNLEASWQIQGLQFNQHQLADLTGSYQLINSHFNNYSKQPAKQHLIQLQEVNLNQLTPLAQDLALEHAFLHKTLTTLNPQGRLRNLSLALHADQTWQLTALLNEVGVEAWEGAPRGQQVNGYLEVHSSGGQVVFISPELELGFPNLYPFHWQTTGAKGRVSWLIGTNKDFWVIGEDLAVQLPSPSKNEPLPIKVSGSFAFHGSQQGQSFYLNLGLLPTSALAQQQLVPSKLLPTEVAHWLYDSIVQGRVDNTAFIFAGPLKQPRFELATGFDALEFKFQPDWPSLKQARGRLNLENGWLKGELSQGKLGDAQLSQASFNTKDKAGASQDFTQQQLNITTDLKTPTRVFPWLIHNSPLQRVIPEAIAAWQFGGQLTGQLNLGINLTNLEEMPQVELTSQLSQASLNLTQINLALEEINGPLNFSLAKGFESQGLTGRMYGERIQAKFLQPSNRLEFTTRLSSKSLGKYLGINLSPEIIDGATLLEGRLNLDPLGELELTSNLAGLSYHLLEPLSKDSSSLQALNASLNFAVEHTPLKVELGEVLSLTGVFLPQLAQLEFTGPLAQGHFLLPLANTSQAYEAQLDYLKLPGAKAVAAEAKTKLAALPAAQLPADPLAEFDPSQLKPFKLDIKEIFRGNQPLGSLQVEFYPETQGFSLKPIQAQLKESQFSGELIWHKKQGTQFKGVSKGANLSASYQALTEEELPVTSEKHQFTFELNWPTSPLAFNLQTAQGKLSLKLDDGSFPKTSGGLSTTSQLFSLLNIDSLFRRLKLDFSDLGKKGITYTSITGSYQLEEGILTNTQPTEVKSSSTRLSLEGEVNLLTQEINQELKLVLPVAQSLPLAAVLVGAPQVGAGIWITQKLFSKKLDKISQATYQITGSLDQPKMELKKVF